MSIGYDIKNNDLIGAERVNSYGPVPRYLPIKRNLTEKERMIVESIPYYPETISVKAIAKLTGLSTITIRFALSLTSVAIQGLICEDDRRLSRLKEGLSNVD